MENKSTVIAIEIGEQTEEHPEPSTSTFQGKTFIITPDQIASLGLIDQIKNVFNSQVAPKISNNSEVVEQKPNKPQTDEKILRSITERKQIKLIKVQRIGSNVKVVPADKTNTDVFEIVPKRCDEQVLSEKKSFDSVTALLDNTQLYPVFLESQVDDNSQPGHSSGNTIALTSQPTIEGDEINVLLNNRSTVINAAVNQDNAVKVHQTKLTGKGRQAHAKPSNLLHNLKRKVKEFDNDELTVDQSIHKFSNEQVSTTPSLHHISPSKIHVLSIDPVNLPELDLKQISQSVVKDKVVSRLVGATENTCSITAKLSNAVSSESLPGPSTIESSPIVVHKTTQDVDNFEPVGDIVVKDFTPSDIKYTVNESFTPPLKKRGHPKKPESEKLAIKDASNSAVLEVIEPLPGCSKSELSLIINEPNQDVPTSEPVTETKVVTLKKGGCLMKPKSEKLFIKDACNSAELEIIEPLPGCSKSESSLIINEIIQDVPTNETVTETEIVTLKKRGRPKKSISKKDASNSAVLETIEPLLGCSKSESTLIINEPIQDVPTNETVTETEIVTLRKRGRPKKSISKKRAIKDASNSAVLETIEPLPGCSKLESSLIINEPIQVVSTSETVTETVFSPPVTKRRNKLAAKEPEVVILDTKRIRKRKCVSEEFIADEEYESALEMADKMAEKVNEKMAEKTTKIPIVKNTSTIPKRRGRRKKSEMVGKSEANLDESVSPDLSVLLDSAIQDDVSATLISENGKPIKQELINDEFATIILSSSDDLLTLSESENVVQKDLQDCLTNAALISFCTDQGIE